MCKMGDIIVVNSYIGDDGEKVSRHSFVVLSDEGGTIAGLDYTMVASVISSFQSEEHRKKVLKREGNMELPIDSKKPDDFKYSSYVKADKAFYFNKKKLDYYVLGYLNNEYFDELLKLVLILAKKGKLKQIVENL